MANKRRNNGRVARWAVSPVLSIPVPGFRIRRRPVLQAPASLFPHCPDVAVNARVGELAQFAGPGGMSDPALPGCPPAKDPDHGLVNERGPSPRSINPSTTAAAPLVGIARLAAISHPAETKRKSEERPEYFLLPVRSILNRCNSKRVPFEWTINPYRGCEFACRYCYARYTHEFMELDGLDFEKKIFVKQHAGVLLRREVTEKYCKAGERPNLDHPEHIAIGTATDPYQPAEREYGVTRSCLEELVKRDGLSISVITKSNQIVRDIDVFKKIAERSELSLNITITTLRARLARLLEPRAPRPDLRVAAVRQLREAGLRVGVSASPLIPGITDREGELEAVAEAVHEAGAQWFFSGVLFLMPSSAKQFLPFIGEKFPRLIKQYEEWYANEAYAPEKYRKMIAERVARLKQKYGFDSRPQRDTQRTTACAQMKLGWDTATTSAAL